MTYKFIQNNFSVFLVLFCFHFVTAIKADEMDIYLAMSPVELSQLSVSIATGSPQPIFQSAAVTSVVTAQQIKSMGATELHEVLETIPGLHVSIQPNTYDAIYTLRGIRNSTNSQVLMLLDGNRFSTPFQGRAVTGLKIPIENIQKIEVIRGPGSAMYGADAFAGVINIMTKKADDIDGTLIGGRVGNWNSQSVWAQHGNHWKGWDIATSVQYQHTTGDDKRIIKADSQTVLDTHYDTHASHAPKAMQTQYEAWNAHLNLQRKHWNIGFWGFNGESGTHAGAAAAIDPQGRADTQHYQGTINYSTEDLLKDWEFLAKLNYLYTDFQTNQLQIFPNDSLLPIGVDGNIDFSSLNPTFFPNGVNDKIGRTQQIPSIEISSIYQGIQNHRLRFQAGYRYEKLETKESKNIGLGSLNGSPPPELIDNEITEVSNTPFVYVPNSSRSIWSLAAQDEWQIVKDIQLTVGLRFDHYSDFGATFNPRVALVWDINQQLTSKLLYGRAFRAPSFSELKNRNNPVLLGQPNLNPEIINTVEWAIDYRPLQSLRTALNLYYYSIKDLINAQSAIGTAGTKDFVAQKNGKQEGFGLEFEWNWQLHEKFSFNGNYAWQQARNKYNNHSIAGVPQQQLYIASQWDFLPKWSFQSQIKWIGKRTNALTDTRKKLDDYEMIDLTLRREKLFGHLNLSASVRNVFNKHAREPAVEILSDHLPTVGRSYYLEASVQF